MLFALLSAELELELELPMPLPACLLNPSTIQNIHSNIRFVKDRSNRIFRNLHNQSLVKSCLHSKTKLA